MFGGNSESDFFSSSCQSFRNGLFLNKIIFLNNISSRDMNCIEMKYSLLFYDCLFYKRLIFIGNFISEQLILLHEI